MYICTCVYMMYACAYIHAIMLCSLSALVVSDVSSVKAPWWRGWRLYTTIVQKRGSRTPHAKPRTKSHRNCKADRPTYHAVPAANRDPTECGLHPPKRQGMAQHTYLAIRPGSGPCKEARVRIPKTQTPKRKRVAGMPRPPTANAEP